MSYNSNYKFTKPFINGKPTRWKQVVDYIKNNSPVSKTQIVKAIWGYDKNDSKFNVTYYDGFGNKYEDNTFRGWNASMFAQINASPVTGVHYNKHIKKWVPDGWEEKQILKAGMKIMRNSIYGNYKV